MIPAAGHEDGFLVLLAYRIEFDSGTFEHREKVADSMTEFETYIRNNCEFIPNFGERRRNGETISTPFVGADDQSGGQPTVREEQGGLPPTF